MKVNLVGLFLFIVSTYTGCHLFRSAPLINVNVLFVPIISSGVPGSEFCSSPHVLTQVFNAQSLQAHFLDFQIYCSCRDYHTIAVSEIRLKPDSPFSVIATENYLLFRQDRETRREGGACLYLHESLSGYLVGSRPQANHPTAVYLFFEVSTGKDLLIAGVIFKPPNSRYNKELKSDICTHVPNYRNV